MKQFDKNEQKRFWSGDESYSKGDIISGVVLSLAKCYIKKNVIDIGAGSGALIRDLKKKYKSNKSIIGVDLTPKSKEIKYGDCTNLPFEDCSFDTYFCTDVIEHLSDSDLNKCLSEVNRILKPNGYGIFTTIDNEKLSDSIVTCPECGCKFHRKGHCQVFNKNRIQTLFCNKGFQIVKIKTIKLHFVAMFPVLARIFYFFHLDRLLNVNFLSADLFFVVRKESGI